MSSQPRPREQRPRCRRSARRGSVRALGSSARRSSIGVDPALEDPVGQERAQRGAGGGVGIDVGHHVEALGARGVDQRERVGHAAPVRPARRLEVAHLHGQPALAADPDGLAPPRRAASRPRRGCGSRRSRGRAPRGGRWRRSRRWPRRSPARRSGRWRARRRRRAIDSSINRSMRASSRAVGGRRAKPIAASRSVPWPTSWTTFSATPPVGVARQVVAPSSATRSPCPGGV